jgi:hypothetical protein
LTTLSIISSILSRQVFAGIPFEVDYGHSGNEMIVQVHLSVKNFVAEYLLDSFGTPMEEIR